MNHVHQICCSPLPFYRIKGYIDHNNQSQACAVPVTGLSVIAGQTCVQRPLWTTWGSVLYLYPPSLSHWL